MRAQLNRGILQTDTQPIRILQRITGMLMLTHPGETLSKARINFSTFMFVSASLRRKRTVVTKLCVCVCLWVYIFFSFTFLETWIVIFLCVTKHWLVLPPIYTVSIKSCVRWHIKQDATVYFLCVSSVLVSSWTLGLKTLLSYVTLHVSLYSQRRL